MANRQRGEVDIDIAGTIYTVGMTVGVLAELADALKIETLDELNERLNRMRLTDALAIITALLKGNGHDVPEAAIKRLSLEDCMATITGAMTAARGGDKRPPKPARAA